MGDFHELLEGPAISQETVSFIFAGLVVRFFRAEDGKQGFRGEVHHFHDAFCGEGEGEFPHEELLFPCKSRVGATNV